MTQQLSSVLLGLVILAWIGWRQLRVRPVKERSLLPLLIVAYGLWQIVQFAGRHAIPAGDWLVLAGSAVLGLGLALWRAFTVRLWAGANGAMVRGTWLTVALWALGLVQHLGSEPFLHSDGLGPTSLVAYLGLVLLLQRELVLIRADRAGLVPHTRGERADALR